MLGSGKLKGPLGEMRSSEGGALCGLETNKDVKATRAAVLGLNHQQRARAMWGCLMVRGLDEVLALLISLYSPSRRT